MVKVGEWWLTFLVSCIQNRSCSHRDNTVRFQLNTVKRHLNRSINSSTHLSANPPGSGHGSWAVSHVLGCTYGRLYVQDKFPWGKIRSFWGITIHQKHITTLKSLRVWPGGKVMLKSLKAVKYFSININDYIATIKVKAWGGRKTSFLKSVSSVGCFSVVHLLADSILIITVVYKGNLHNGLRITCVCDPKMYFYTSGFFLCFFFSCVLGSEQCQRRWRPGHFKPLGEARTKTQNPEKPLRWINQSCLTLAENTESV